MKSQIIKNSLISEKAYKNMEQAIYTFLVDKVATKKDVALAVKKYFNVEVVKVNISTVPSKGKRVNKTRKFTQVGGGKKAIVWLKKGQNIEILSPKTPSKKSDKKTEKNEKPKEKSQEKKDE